MKSWYFGNNINIYIIIMLASMCVVLLGINIYENTRSKTIELSNKNKIAISENILNTFQSWFDERINSLIRASTIIEHSDMLSNNNMIDSFLEIFANKSPEFDAVQLLAENGDLWINDQKLPAGNRREVRLGFIWYAETKMLAKPTVNFMPRHNILDQGTLNICVPNFYKEEFKAVLCGIVKVQSIFEKMNNFKLPPNSYSFIITHSGEILTPMDDKELKDAIEKNFKELFLKDSDKTTLNLESNFIAISEIKYLNWFIGAGSDNQKETRELLRDITKNGLLLLCGFIILAIGANLLHGFMYSEIDRRKKEYELILSHKAKMSELGELLSGINHQFIQPVNSLKLIVSTLLMLRRENKLSNEKLDSMLANIKRSIFLLSDTIEIFRNFYNTNESVREFSIRKSIKNLLTLMHTELSRANVSVNLNEFNDIKVSQIENIIQQILLILIHNAKDAVVDKFKDEFKLRQVSIDVKFDEKNCYIDVIEFGNGIDKKMGEKIFQTPNTTKKFGSGIGLYFGKKLANEKIRGDISLVSISMPTVFRFSFAINLGDRNGSRSFKATV